MTFIIIIIKCLNGPPRILGNPLDGNKNFSPVAVFLIRAATRVLNFLAVDDTHATVHTQFTLIN